MQVFYDNDEAGLISNATALNWKRLQTKPEGRLTSRANKRRSLKKFLPKEYFVDKGNIPFVKNLLELIETEQADIYSVIFSLGVNLLKKQGIYSKPHVRDTLREYDDVAILKNFLAMELPANEVDILGIIYQACLQEGKKNTRGSYYTPSKIVDNMTRRFDFSKGETFLDPCCGSGAFLIALSVANPNQIYGLDNDRIAVLIAKINLLLKYSAIEFAPQIYCLDFLALNRSHPIYRKKFDYIATNPPWGAASNLYKETFAIFFVKAFRQLKAAGVIRFLFPEAVLNVNTHKNLRNFILNNAGLVTVTKYENLFSGVTTGYIDIECENKSNKRRLCFISGDDKNFVDMKTVSETKNLNFNCLCAEDISIIRAFKSKGHYSLKDSVWALGIVTGDNKNKVLSAPRANAEKIYTGKEIQPFTLKPAKRWLVYDRNNLQQVAKDEIYRAPEKLAYKFISSKLIFAYDNTQSLFLNSANILIPTIPNMSTKATLAFLNSALFNFVYIKLFGGVKVLKTSLTELSFPKITAEENVYLTSLTDDILAGASHLQAKIETFIFSFYGISKAQSEYIRRFVNGKAD